MTQLDLGLLRLVAQHVADPHPGGPADVVSWMTAMQGQDLPSVLAAVAVRTAAGDGAGVAAALASGALVRSWPMRGTLHLVAGRDLGWMLTLGPPRVATAVRRRQQQLGLDDAILDRAAAVAFDALSGRLPLRREELAACWEQHGIVTSRGRGPLLVQHLAHTGLICLGPLCENGQAVVLLDEWVPDQRRLGRDEALGEWALRYFRSHGPATVRDFAWWSGLSLTEVRAGLALARAGLEAVDVDGVEHLMDPGLPDRLRADAGGVFLLPGFDELVLGYSNRSASVDDRFAARLAPGGNGIYRPFVVAGGRIVATWRPSAEKGPVLDPFVPLDGSLERAAADRFGSFPRAATGWAGRAGLP